ncbi:MAG: CCA tRNA nucleotidyltransferase [Rhizobiales bacterium PAR1]|nr:MAG: CCA tRNA nucleotidyltransferase [Rhizobiales bacterium PAR1]
MIEAAARARLAALLADPVLAGLLDGLNPPGEETRIVGGAIRNALLGEPVADIDLGTTLLPDQSSKRAVSAGWQAIPTGIEHGTVTLVKEGRSFEVTTLREDIETDGRRAVVRFGRDFAHDAARRDFTINALSMGRDGEIHDYFEGLRDLAARKVRFIGDPDQRIREDYLRGLRFFRFSAAYGEGLDEAGLAAVVRQRAGFAGLSRERVRQEFLKLLMARRAVEVIGQGTAHGLLSDILGLPVFPDRLRDRLAFAARHAGDVVSLPARLYAVAVTDDASVTVLRHSLRLTNAEERYLTRLVEARSLFRHVVGLKAAVFQLGDRFSDVGPEVLRLAAIEAGDDALLQHLPAVENPPVFHITGKDALALGVPAGPKVGLLLQAAKIAWAVRGCTPDVEVQRAILAETLAAMG